jgi:hypothetical protein
VNNRKLYFCGGILVGAEKEAPVRATKIVDPDMEGLFHRFGRTLDVQHHAVGKNSGNPQTLRSETVLKRLVIGRCRAESVGELGGAQETAVLGALGIVNIVKKSTQTLGVPK